MLIQHRKPPWQSRAQLFGRIDVCARGFEPGVDIIKISDLTEAADWSGGRMAGISFGSQADYKVSARGSGTTAREGQPCGGILGTRNVHAG